MFWARIVDSKIIHYFKFDDDIQAIIVSSWIKCF